MLVVIGIIGLLASVVLVGLTNARKAGRDARRIADLRTIQNALELYYNKFEVYPPGSSFAQMSATLTGSAIGVSAVPRDPLNNGPYQYNYTSIGQEYILSTTLEDRSHRAYTDDIDGGFCNDNNPGGYCVGVVTDVGAIPPPSTPSPTPATPTAP